MTRKLDRHGIQFDRVCLRLTQGDMVVQHTHPLRMCHGASNASISRLFRALPPCSFTLHSHSNVLTASSDLSSVVLLNQNESLMSPRAKEPVKRAQTETSCESPAFHVGPSFMSPVQLGLVHAGQCPYANGVLLCATSGLMLLFTTRNAMVARAYWSPELKSLTSAPEFDKHQ